MEGGVWCRLSFHTVPASNSLSLPFLITSLSIVTSLLALFFLASLHCSYIEESWESVRPMDNPPGYDEAHGISTKDKAADKRWYGPLVCVRARVHVRCPPLPPSPLFQTLRMSDFLTFNQQPPPLAPPPPSFFSSALSHTSFPSLLRLPNAPTTTGAPPSNMLAPGSVPFDPGAILSITTPLGGREG